MSVDPKEIVLRLTDAANYQARHDPPLDKLLVVAALCIDRLSAERDALKSIGNGIEPAGCPTPGACSCPSGSSKRALDAAWTAGAEAMRRAAAKACHRLVFDEISNDELTTIEDCVRDIRAIPVPSRGEP